MKMKVNQKILNDCLKEINDIDNRVQKETSIEMFKIIEHYITNVKKVMLKKSGTMRKLTTRTDKSANKISKTSPIEYMNGVLEMFVGNNLVYARRREYEELKNAPTSAGTGPHAFYNTLEKHENNYKNRFIRALIRAIMSGKQG